MASTLTTPPESASASNPLEALADWLCEHPGQTDIPPKELAARFGLDQRLVEDVIEALEYSQPEVGFFRELGRRIRSMLGPVKRMMRLLRLKTERWLESETNHPVRFVVITGLAAYVFGFGLPVISSLLASGGVRLGVMLATVIFVGIIFCLHLYCYFRHRMLRYPLYGAFAMYLLHLPFNIGVATLIQIQQGQLFVVTAIGIAVGFLILTAIYLPVGFLASLVGGYAQVQTQVKRNQQMTRQELLGRLFEMETRLSRASASQEGMKRRRTIKALLQSAPSYPAFAAALGFCLGAIRVAILGIMVALMANPNPGQELAINLTTLVLEFGLMVMMGFIGYFAGSAWRALFSSLVCYGAALLAYLLPVGPYGPNYFQENALSAGFLAYAIIAASIGLMAGMGASVERSTRHSRRFRADDPAILLAELVQIKRRLSVKSESACVVVVDVAGSTAMKAKADPFDIEYTFREYQRLVSRQVQRRGGDVISTAGDGAVAAFRGVPEALHAAKSIQAEMSRFNAEVNRLGTPFRLRIGIHAGQTRAGLDEVPFNELIDIAAHVEQNAPVGGIAVTGAVTSLIEDEGMVEVNKIVDNQQLYIVLNPIEA